MDIEEGDAFVAGLPNLAARTHRPEVLAGIGGFAGLFRIEPGRYRDPVLVSGTDGVGTKLLIAIDAGRHTSIGIDLVAMCVNDIITVGAEPLFFLDYFATGKLDRSVGRGILEGIVEGCVQAGCALIGGETAEMPGMYRAGHYDLAGFSVGVVERDAIIDGTRIQPGDVCIGVASSGLHSNGYSLVRHALLEIGGLTFDSEPPELDRPLVDVLLEPTRIYANSVKALAPFDIRGIAHITGGGIAGNLVRVLPKGILASLDRSAWVEPPIFQLLRRMGVPPDEMDKTFNLGVGLILVCAASEVHGVLASLQDSGETAFRLGSIGSGEQGVVLHGEPRRS